MHREHHGLLFAVLGALLLALTAVLIRWTPVPTSMIVFARFAICSLTVLPWILQKKVAITPVSIRKHAFRAFLGLGSIAAYFYSVTHLSIMNAVTLSNTAPLFLPFIVFFWLKKIIPRSRLIALLIGFVGVVVILRPSPDMQVTAAFFGLFGGFCSSLVQIGIRKLSLTESTQTILVHYFVIAAVIAFFPMLYFWEPINNPMLWIHLIVLGLVSALYQYCFTRSLESASATKVSAVNYLGVPFGGILGWLFFGETPSFWVAIGTALIICGGIIAIFSKEESRHRHPPS